MDACLSRAGANRQAQIPRSQKKLLGMTIELTRYPGNDSPVSCSLFFQSASAFCMSRA